MKKSNSNNKQKIVENVRVIQITNVLGIALLQRELLTYIVPAVPKNSGILPNFIMKSKMADTSLNILYDSVRFILSNWTVLQLAVEHGFGGIDSREKAEWMVNVVNQVLQENGQYFPVLWESSLILSSRVRFSSWSFSSEKVHQGSI